jgi:hypothetical protein
MAQNKTTEDTYLSAGEAKRRYGDRMAILVGVGDVRPGEGPGQFAAAYCLAVDSHGDILRGRGILECLRPKVGACQDSTLLPQVSQGLLR